MDTPSEPSRQRHSPARTRLRGKGYLRRLGPGIVTGAADDDPSGIGTYSQVGAATGNSLLWSGPLLLPLAFAVQEACARLALVTGQGLAGIIKRRLPRPILYLCLALVVIANTVNIAADLGSMAAALQLLIPVPQALGVIGEISALALSFAACLHCSVVRCRREVGSSPHGPLCAWFHLDKG